MMQPIIVGFGHCGRNLHLASLRTLHRQGRLGNVDSSVIAVDPAVRVVLPEQVSQQRQLPDAASLSGKHGVVHVCTPPAMHLQHVRQALEAGYRCIILEKPMVMDPNECTQLLALQARYQARILVVSVWSHSQLVPRLMQWLHGREDRLRRVRVEHHKPRFSRTLARNDEHLFDIEMPHQVSLALLFAKGPRDAMQCAVQDLQLQGSLRPAMKSGSINWVDEHAIEVRLDSDLSSPVRQRSIRLELEDGHWCEGFFPVSADDSYAQFRCSTAVALDAFPDEPLTACLGRYYQHFSQYLAGNADDAPLGSTLAFNQQVVALLDLARTAAAAASSALPHDALAKEAI
ncbi:TPA: Gfo/Idh/MocA family oxidoreductase [Pseudomonas putida]|uniref:Gfo/Idh/MocA family oxidoreductase n=1 Tax=Pseudomonas TaxID=286 RepID=UPI00110CBD6A|nr:MULTISPECIES: Gfo/Idh/MocA family oxidoreductase [Pseudomonas]MDD1995063.1 Gfo/Idh/MocA family oxidoreductase [Pseudomonas putida]HDS0919420.1 Gfo/Idh/MocA family oxidoreductase [Pseudomonas putida]HDS0933808.1 Gfo/Idh/MocA family oxidoreductase [Pseudomonas putida]HDS1783920.1 Gfo/Idh/MocA family oxidoreductase [Pseudomonas putida]HDS3799722.1 Gfo/Idh/MocA family oxidoreductase [Pseudomonas putida]